MLKRQQADFDDIQTIISTATVTEFQKKDAFSPKKSSRISRSCPVAIADFDTWIEIIVTNTSSGNRSLFYSVNSHQAKWDEPPSGASKVVYKSDVDEFVTRSAEKKKKMKSTSSKSRNNGMLGATPTKAHRGIKPPARTIVLDPSDQKNGGKGNKLAELLAFRNEDPTENMRRENYKVGTHIKKSPSEVPSLVSDETERASGSLVRKEKRTNKETTAACMKSHQSKGLGLVSEETKNAFEKDVVKAKRANEAGGVSIRSPPQKIASLGSEETGNNKLSTFLDSIKSTQQDDDSPDLLSTSNEISLQRIQDEVDIQLASIEKELLETPPRLKETSSRTHSYEKGEITKTSSFEHSELPPDNSSQELGEPLPSTVVNCLPSCEKNESNNCQIMCHAATAGNSTQHIFQENNMQQRLDKLKYNLISIENSILETCNTNKYRTHRSNRKNTIKEVFLNTPGESNLRNTPATSQISVFPFSEKVAGNFPEDQIFSKTTRAPSGKSNSHREQTNSETQKRLQMLEKSRERRLRQAGLDVVL